MSINKSHLAMYIRFLSGGGAERIFVNLMPELIKRGVKVDLLINMADGPYLPTFPCARFPPYSPNRTLTSDDTHSK